MSDEDYRMPTVFVDAEHGDDKNDGSESAPVRTKERAYQLAAGITPGSTGKILYASRTDEGIEWSEQDE